MTRIATLLVIVILLGCNSNRDLPILPPSGEEYAIYSVIMDSVYYRIILEKDAPKLVVILDSTIRQSTVDSSMTRVRKKGDTQSVYSDRFDYYERGFPIADWLALKDPFNKASSKRFPLCADSITLATPYRMLSQDSLSKIFSRGTEDGWTLFRQLYPKSAGYICFSRVGFNEKSLEAVVYYEHRYDGLGGEGSFAVLKKQNDKWVLIKRVTTWVS